MKSIVSFFYPIFIKNRLYIKLFIRQLPGFFILSELVDTSSGN